MSWQLSLTFNVSNQLIATVTPPNNCYCEGGMHFVDINSPYLEGITLDGYQDGDYIVVLEVNHDCNVGNSGTIPYNIDLWKDLEGSGYAYVVVYDSTENEGVKDVRTGEKVTNQL